MGIDYKGIGGLGIKLTDEMLNKICSKSEFTEDDFDDDVQDCLTELGFKAEQAGSCYSGDLDDYIMIKGNNLQEILDNEIDFINKLKEFDIEIKREDIKVISDYLIW